MVRLLCVTVCYCSSECFWLSKLVQSDVSLVGEPCSLWRPLRWCSVSFGETRMFIFRFEGFRQSRIPSTKLCQCPTRCVSVVTVWQSGFSRLCMLANGPSKCKHVDVVLEGCRQDIRIPVIKHH